MTDTFALDVDVDLYTIQPHAHLLAKEVKSYATLPDGTRKWLIYIREWDFNWQGVFRYARPEFLPAGTTITFEFTYDNSAENPHNPHRPPRRVTYGQHTTDEMAELWLQVVTRNPADRARLARAARERDRARRDRRRREAARDGSRTTRRCMTTWRCCTRRPVISIARRNISRRRSRLQPDSAAAHYNLGNALFRQGRRAEAIESLRKALALEPDYALAHDGLGVALYTDGSALMKPRSTTGGPSNSTRATWSARYHLVIALRQLLAINPNLEVIKGELVDVERPVAA